MPNPFKPEDHWFHLLEEFGDGQREYRTSFLSNDEDTPIEVIYLCLESRHAWHFERRIQTVNTEAFHSFRPREVIVRKQFDAETIEVIARDNDCLPPSEIT